MDIKERKRLIEEMRTRLNTAVKKAKGDFGSSEVYALSRQLDYLINEYLLLIKGKLD